MSYASPPPQRYINSILDTDLYKLTMQRAVLETFPDVLVKYRFTNRGEHRFTRKVHAAVLKAVDRKLSYYLPLLREEENRGKGTILYLRRGIADQSPFSPFSPSDLSSLSLTVEERSWLEKRCPYFPPSYLDYLEQFRFNPKDQLNIEFVSEGKNERGEEIGNFEIDIKGKWCETVSLRCWKTTELS